MSKRNLPALWLLAGCIVPSQPTFPASGKVGGPHESMTGSRTKGENPFKNAYWMPKPRSNAERTASMWRSSRSADAAALDKIAGQPAAAWMGNWNPRIADDVEIYVKQHVWSGALADVDQVPG